MENLELTTEEKMEIEKRGFLVKNIYGYGNLSIINDIIKYLGFMIISLLGISVTGIYVLIPIYIVIVIKFGEKISDIIGITTLIIISLSTIILFSIPLIRSIYGYFNSGKTFYNNDSIIENGFIKSINTFEKNNSYLSWIHSFMGSSNKETTIIFYGAFILFLIIISYGLELISYSNVLLVVLYIVLFTLIGRFLYQSFHPLYAFGNLGEKIQELTPEIEEQSKQIQSEFRSDMNFSVLSDGFDSLSATFSKIVTLVIKLEKVEKRANKGNLFDSEKYINSLRSDIVEPLSSLREFLEIQKNKLFETQKELTQVRVGGSESTGNIELQSKRSESLIQELTENIEKLDVMIQKMGK